MQIDELKQAIDANDLDRVVALMTEDPSLHRAPIGYKNSGPLTWVAECRIPWEPPTTTRLAIAQWMIDNGSDVHQGGDAPLMRASLNADRILMMDLLIANGADVDALCFGEFPILFAPCETLDPIALKHLLDHGANPNTARGSALDYAIHTYSRTPDLGACMEILLDSGATTQYDIPPVFDLLRNRIDLLAGHLDAAPSLVHRRFEELDFGSTATRGLTLRGATLLHVAAEYCNPEAARLLLDRGADVNARGDVYGQTPVFHAASQFADGGIEVVRILVDRGADLSIRATLPGRFDHDELIDATALEYASRFPGEDERHGGRLNNRQTIALLAR